MKLQTKQSSEKLLQGFEDKRSQSAATVKVITETAAFVVRQKREKTSFKG